jgi:hypothetical protein
MPVVLFLLGTFVGFFVFVSGIAFFLVFRDDGSDGEKRRPVYKLALEILFFTPIVACFNPFPIAAAYLGYLGYKLALGKLDESCIWIFLGIAFSLSFNLWRLRNGRDI